MVAKKDRNIGAFKNAKKSKMLLVFIGISLLFWMLIKLSKRYTDLVQFNVTYINLPKGKMLQQNPPDNIDIAINTFGFNLIKYHLNKKDVVIDLHTVKRKKKFLYYQISKELLPQIQQQMAADVSVVSIQPDSIYFHLGISKTKKVPIVPDLTIQYQSGYNLLGDLKIEPNYISISGPEVLIDSISAIKTEAKTLTDINSSIDIKLPIVKLKQASRVNYSSSEVTIKGSVEKFTEARLKLPILVKNLPKNYTITTFPDQVEVVFQVGISDYNKINKNDFKISCNYHRTTKNGLDYLIPEVISKPSIVSKVKIIPSKIEYLIKK